MKALLIEFNINTGERPGGISPKDKNTRCFGWQNLDVTPALEIRLIEDDRDVGQYEGVEGIIILHNNGEIQAAIDALPTAHSIDNSDLFKISVEQKGINLDTVPGANSKEQLANLHTQGVKGIARKDRRKLVDVYPKEKVGQL